MSNYYTRNTEGTIVELVPQWTDESLSAHLQFRDPRSVPRRTVYCESVPSGAFTHHESVASHIAIPHGKPYVVVEKFVGIGYESLSQVVGSPMLYRNGASAGEFQKFLREFEWLNNLYGAFERGD